MKFSSIDIFCEIIDNFGDIGVTYRFAKEFKNAHPDCSVRVFVNDLALFGKINPSAMDSISSGMPVEHRGITIIDSSTLTDATVGALGIAEVLVEAFGCTIPKAVMDRAYTESTLLINLEYLSAEPWIEGYHLKESLLPAGTLKKFFYMPGFTAASGGVIIDSDMEKNKAEVLRDPFSYISPLVKKYGFPEQLPDHELTGTVFTYDHDFTCLLSSLGRIDRRVLLLVFGEKSRDGMIRSLNDPEFHEHSRMYHKGNLTVVSMPIIPQNEYDLLLCAADFNIVRGEDSWVRAIQAGKPFIWNAYIQDKKYQLVKVHAFMEVFRRFFTDSPVYDQFDELMVRFNDIDKDRDRPSTDEDFTVFFDELDKIKQASMRMSYFIIEHCSLIEKFSAMLCNF